MNDGNNSDIYAQAVEGAGPHSKPQQVRPEMQKLKHNEKIADHSHQDADLKNDCWYYNCRRKRFRLIAAWCIHAAAEGSKDGDEAYDEMIDVEYVILKFFELSTKVKVPQSTEVYDYP